MSNDGARIMEMYWNGNRDVAIEEMCKRVKPIITWLIRKFHVPDHLKEDVFQEGYMAIMEKIEDYNPSISSPETFFKIYIQHNVYEYVNKEIYHCPKCHIGKIVKVKDAKEYLKKRGLLSSVSQISLKSGLKSSDVIKTLNHINRVKQAAYGSEDENDIPNGSISVESSVIKHMQIDDLYKSINKLGKRQKNIICSVFGLYGHKRQSVKVIAKYYNTSESTMRNEIDKTLIVIKHYMGGDGAA